MRKVVYAAVLVLLGGLVAFVQPSAWAAPPRCNVDVVGWPGCIPGHDDFVRALHAPEDSTFFWSGRVGGEGGWSVIDRAGEIARMYGGTTLEERLNAQNVGMPLFTDVDAFDNRIAEYYEDDDQYLVNAAWTDASHVLANQARGIVYVVLGDWQRPDNVFNGTGNPEAGVEFAALRANPAVWGIVRVDPVTLRETPFWARDGYTPEEVERYAAYLGAARACPTVEAHNFPTASAGNGTFTSAAPTPTPTRYHSTRIGTRLYGDTYYWPLETHVAADRRTTWSTVPSPTPMTTPTQYGDWLLGHSAFHAHGNGTPDAFTIASRSQNGLRRGYSYVGARRIKCNPPRDELKKRDLRVMPLGDSITFGIESTDGNGYREELHSELAAGENNVNFVGSESGGSMDDNENEGHPGWRIDQVATIAKCTVPQYQPNVITLHAGTNDANQNYQIDTADDRVKALIDQALTDSPKATVIVSQIIPTGKAGLQDRIDKMNDEITQVIEAEAAAGKHVMAAEQFNLRLTDGIQNDAHPTDAGYDKMGANFYEAIETANDQGWITTPDPVRSTSPDCDEGATALGEGWRKLGVIAPGMTRPSDYSRTELAEMNGDARADYVQVRKDGSIRVGINTVDQPGQPTWLPWLGGTGEFYPGGGRVEVPTDPNAPTIADQIRFADIDGSGRDDVILVTPDGDMTAYLNLSLTDTSPPAWTKMEDFAPVKNVPRDHIRFADLNGDGRDDYLRVGDNGEVHAYFNNPDPESTEKPRKPKWVEKLSWAPGVNGASLANLRFADVDGDHKADYLMVGADGSVHAYLNKGGKDAGGFEPHLNWANASNYPREYVTFRDISGDGKADYLVVYREGAVRAWLNRGGNL